MTAAPLRRRARRRAEASLLGACLVLAAAACGAPGGHDEPASSTTAPESPQDALDRLDGRVPVPLVAHMADHQKRNMRDHLVAVQEIVLAAARDDYATIEASATRMGSSDAMTAMCTHMGAGAPGFTEQALAFHASADVVAEAARRHDLPAVLHELGATLQRCTGCHATFRQALVDDAGFTRLTAQPVPGGH
ncbi:MAG: cytochrome c [Planctomycetes bacterium]|nr:cytochrome c [Planctomycetota bacterium]